MVLLSLSIFNFSGPSALIHGVAQRLGRMTGASVLEIGAACLLLLAAWFLVRRLNGTRRHIAVGVLCVLSIRLLLFGNPAAWIVYGKVLRSNGVEERMRDVTLYETAKYMRQPESLEYLAIGSSQAGAFFSGYAAAHSDFACYSLAGMGPLEFLLYKDFISGFHPRNVILYLSEFDMARPPAFSAVKMAPAQRAYWWPLVRTLGYGSFWKKSQGALVEGLIGEFLPEYKYAFLFREMIDLLSGAHDALDDWSISTLPDDERLQVHLERLTTSFTEENIALQIAPLEMFLCFCEERGVGVILVEGEYHPDACTEENRRLNGIVHDTLLEIAGRSGNVCFIPRGTLGVPVGDDFRDGYHMKKECAYEFVERLMAIL